MKGKSVFTQSEADEIIKLIRQKLVSDASTQKIIRDKIRKIGFYASDFGLGGGYNERDFLSVVRIEGTANKVIEKRTVAIKSKEIKDNTIKRAASDECYILDLCDEVLEINGIRQHRFDFLKGDAGTKLPVDIYYPTLNLVIEYRERQHTEEVKFFDRRITKSGESRGEQRKKYDELRRNMLPAHGIKLIEIGYDEFQHTKSKRLIRNRAADLTILKSKLLKVKA